MNKNLLVEIFVPTGGKRGYIATGYPVARNRILTARHVLFPADRDEQSPIVVRWYHQREEARQWRPINNIVWEGGEDLDAAVPDCDFPASVDDWGVLSVEKPSENMKWVSEGFARAGKRDDDRRNPIAMKGEVFSVADSAREFEIGENYPPELSRGLEGGLRKSRLRGRQDSWSCDHLPRDLRRPAIDGDADRSAA